MLSVWTLIKDGGFAMYPLLACSFAAWAVIFERFWRYRKLKEQLKHFHLEALNTLIRSDHAALKKLCAKNSEVPTAQVLEVALERLGSDDARLRSKWYEAMERKRALVNQDLRQGFSVLGTIASASPFIGLFGTVVGILRSFHQMSQTGSGGFTVVAGGISESLIATAAGIVVAVIAVMAFNTFQTKWGELVLTIRLQLEELAEMLSHGT